MTAIPAYSIAALEIAVHYKYAAWLEDVNIASMQLTAEQSRRLLDIARGAIRQALAGQLPAAVAETDSVLMSPAGCFVSLHQQGTHELRGCVGRLEANGPLAQVVQETAVSALGDPRFVNKRIQLGELGNLDIEISVVSPLTAVKNPLDFDLLNDGLFLIISNRTGCFLPQVARQTGWSKEQLLDRLCVEKMGFPAKMWQHPAARLQKFTVGILGPVCFEELRAASGS